MIPQMSPYTPELYQPDSYGRYRKYPRFTRTPIPGAGFKVGELVWAEQELNLNGGPPQQYGTYSQVPLRGLDGAALRMNIPKPASTMAPRQQTAATSKTQVQHRRPSMPASASAPMRYSQPARMTPLRPQSFLMAPQRAQAQTTLSRSGESTLARTGSRASAAPLTRGGSYASEESDEPDNYVLERRDGEAHDLGQSFDLALPAQTYSALAPKMTAQTTLSPSSSSGGGAPGVPSAEDYGYDVAEEIAKAQAAAEEAVAPTEPEETTNFFMRKVGPVPYWAIGLGSLVVIGGGVYWATRR